MLILWQFFLFFTIFKVVNSNNNNYSNLLNGLINVFKNMNVHTVSTSTCWDTSKDTLMLIIYKNYLDIIYELITLKYSLLNCM